MPISDYYKNIRAKIGTDLIFMPSVAAIIKNDQNEILFQYIKGEEQWSLPAGAIELGEPPAKAVIREVFEETGLLVKPLHLIGIFGGEDFRFTYSNKDQVEYNIFVFNCKIISGKLTAIDGESSDLKFFNVYSKPELALPYPEVLFHNLKVSDAYFQWNDDWLKLNN
ncbi:NUDIX domain-containing protein [Oceanobacillus jeddahense]|uniref:NUDIX domain-containing protein n=1 Tax=Oceanobacillus jeddahense TaxID=1462527 RepID=A0ABY5JYT3_9BACI|nr:NUDIX domain-containing protein [Oceanobacillus jeddahense]UUI05385.1 NUDIX domain-containing protein [Oceanobacillus jeddahense]